MKNSKSKYILIIITFLIISIIYFYVATNKSFNNKANTYQNISRTSTQINDENSNSQTSQDVSKEIQISTYSTVIKDNAIGRLTNIRLTCNVINEHMINPGETFSFNEVVGKPTVEKGYQEAKIIIDHKTETGIGGGNCQVSSTLYNAVLSVPNLVIVERHEHGKDVAYVPKGKDAAVSYGSLDLKFRNDSDYKIRINLKTDDTNITATLTRID